MGKRALGVSDRIEKRAERESRKRCRHAAR